MRARTCEAVFFHMAVKRLEIAEILVAQVRGARSPFPFPRPLLSPPPHPTLPRVRRVHREAKANKFISRGDLY